MVWYRIRGVSIAQMEGLGQRWGAIAVRVVGAGSDFTENSACLPGCYAAGRQGWRASVWLGLRYFQLKREVAAGFGVVGCGVYGVGAGLEGFGYRG